MNKLSLYTLLILLFLGLSKNFSPSEQKTPYIQDEKVLGHYFVGAPLSVVLTETFQIGFLIRTYFMRLKIVHGFKSPEEVIVRTSKDFWDKNQKYLGMSLFRRYENKQEESIVPMPPGALYVGNLAFGRWGYANSGEKIWRFHKPYQHYSRVFGWLDFVPNYEFYKIMKIHMKNEQPFFGLNKEFGAEGAVTVKAFTEKVSTREFEKLSIKEFFKKFIASPRWTAKLKVEKK